MIDLGAESFYTVLGVAPTATAAEIRQARDTLVRELRERQRREPTRRAELEARQKVVNTAGEELARPAKRALYDRDNAHLRFFTVRDAAAGIFTDRADRVEVLYTAISDHLRARGVTLRPRSDLDRDDFTADMTPNSVLDGPIG
jgi:curved DNA-binding protein CbpA